MKKLIWLDDLRNPLENDWIKFSPIEQPFEIIWLKSYEQFTRHIMKFGLPDAICFDHDLGEDIAKEKVSSGMNKKKVRKEKKETKSGMDCAKWLVEYCMDTKSKLPLFNVQSANPAGKDNINGLLMSFIENGS